MGKSIEVKDIIFKYNETTILKELNLKIEEKAFTSIIGPNGSGKSTLLKIIAKNLVPHRGNILLGDKDLRDYAAKSLAQEMAVVHQSTEVAYDFSVEDIVLMGRHPHLKRFQREGLRDFQIVKEAMELTNTWHLKERSINEISGGERQRVIIARALAQEPQIILLDEPTSALDIHHQMEVLDLLRQLNEEKGVTIVVVLHDLNLAARYSKEILLLHEGNRITMGKTEEVITVENLKKAYNMEMIVDRNVYTGALQVLPLSTTKTSYQRKTKEKKLHIVCGGGVGKELIQSLYDEGYTMSIGVVNIGDSDWEIANILGLEMAEESPFSPISDDAFEEACRLAEKADITILTSIPIGKGNVKNLSIIQRQLETEKPVYFYKAYESNKKFDYTDGEGEILFGNLLNKGLQVLTSKDKLLKKLEE
ncbi:heme ABC transporter ATP-binding protein [Natronincola ferrireducens]|uniref:Iron complex transport system ATP-binding protein n=1 Tax=Natronincola ferrireducens TaxID=393762 RepID=A0A1G9E161_9FIRM|nr:heme ABC transporter ATP-binding protein [Natronincola ferrireducens]SDK69849.1 iron complex transport system ATP-binding protein [Natronincola ferrireducens]